MLQVTRCEWKQEVMKIILTVGSEEPYDVIMIQVLEPLENQLLIFERQIGASSGTDDFQRKFWISDLNHDF